MASASYLPGSARGPSPADAAPHRRPDRIDRGPGGRPPCGASPTADWSVHGTAKVTGNVEADTVEVDGTASVGGKLTSVELGVHGRLDVVGDARANHRLAVVGSGPVRRAPCTRATSTSEARSASRGPSTSIARCSGGEPSNSPAA